MKRKATFASLLAFFLLATSMATAASPALPTVGLAKDLIYFVMPDRYANGDRSNDSVSGDIGFDPSEKAFFHGGDLKGLTGTCTSGDNGLARIKSLGFTAVWITPIVVQAPATSHGAGYHGYWGLDFLNVDPHLGTKDDLKAFMECAKKQHLKIILDVVTNHTGDVISYENQKAFIPAGQENAKSPSWLNDLTNYHNVGAMDKCWGDGSCLQIGDFYSLDDLATEKQAVYQGWADVYGKWIKDFGFSGFRVDTARHVDDNFFKNWSPLIQNSAQSAGISNFTIFGEVAINNVNDLMTYVRRNKLQTVLDFPFQKSATDFASGYSGAADLESLFLSDDLYTSATSDANNLVTFIGNHDMGRSAYIIESRKVQKANQLLPRTLLANALMYFSRGIPTVYYGDEVGMTGTGDGTDQLARQDMFPTQVGFWKSEARVGGKLIGNGDSFAVTATNPIAKYIKSLAALRSANPGLSNSQMQIRSTSGSLFVISKKDVKENREYVVAFNNSDKAQKAVVTTATSQGGWKVLLGSPIQVVKGEKITLTVPALSTVILKANKTIDLTSVKPGKLIVTEDDLTGFLEAKAALTTSDLLTVNFEAKMASGGGWQPLGVDTNAPYRVYIDPQDFLGQTLEIRATATNSKGKSYELSHATVSIPAS